MRFGRATVERAVEWVGPVRPVADLFPGIPGSVWQEHAPVLAPTMLEPSTGLWRAAMQTWVVRLPGLLVLIDTGVGNGRARPQAPALAGLDTPFLERLADVGVRPEDVDVVVNTHIHYDHVGWNTRWAGGRWVPTFPNARYVVPEADYEYFRPERASKMRPARTDEEQARFDGIALVFDDSIRPIAEAGRLQLWSGSLRLHPALHLEQTPGHTPGSCVAWLDDGEGAVFVGDLLHSPVQLLRPHDACAFDLEADEAAASRRAVLERAARERRWLFPSHVAGRGALRLGPGDALADPDWAEFDEI